MADGDLNPRIDLTDDEVDRPGEAAPPFDEPMPSPAAPRAPRAGRRMADADWLIEEVAQAAEREADEEHERREPLPQPAWAGAFGPSYGELLKEQAEEARRAADEMAKMREEATPAVREDETAGEPEKAAPEPPDYEELAKRSDWFVPSRPKRDDLTGDASQRARAAEDERLSAESAYAAEQEQKRQDREAAQAAPAEPAFAMPAETYGEQLKQQADEAKAATEELTRLKDEAQAAADEMAALKKAMAEAREDAEKTAKIAADEWEKEREKLPATSAFAVPDKTYGEEVAAQSAEFERRKEEEKKRKSAEELAAAAAAAERAVAREKEAADFYAQMKLQEDLRKAAAKKETEAAERAAEAAEKAAEARQKFADDMQKAFDKAATAMERKIDRAIDSGGMDFGKRYDREQESKETKKAYENFLDEKEGPDRKERKRYEDERESKKAGKSYDAWKRANDPETAAKAPFDDVARLAGKAGMGNASAMAGKAGDLAGAMAGGGGAMAAAGPVGAALAMADEVAKQVAGAIQGLGNAAKTTGDVIVDLAGNNHLGAFQKASDGVAGMLEKIPIVGQVWAAEIQAATKVVTAFAEVTEAFVRRGKELARFSPDTATANARTEMAETMADIREANALGSRIADLTDAQTDVSIEIREVLIPIKQAILDDLIPIVRELAVMVRAIGAGMKGAREFENHVRDTLHQWGDFDFRGAGRTITGALVNIESAVVEGLRPRPADDASALDAVIARLAGGDFLSDEVIPAPLPGGGQNLTPEGIR